MTRPSAWRRRLARLAAGSALVALAVTMLAALVQLGGTAQMSRARVQDMVAARVPADPRVVVVALDEDFFERTDDANFRLTSVANALGYTLGSATDSYLVRDDVFDAVNPGMATSEFDAFAARVFANFDGAVLGRTRVAVLAGEDGDVPTVVGEEPVDQLRAAVEAIGFDSTAPTGAGDVVRSVALIGRPEDADDEVIPSTALLALLRAEGVAATIEANEDEIVLGETHIPVEENGRVTVSYSNDLLPGGGSVVAASDVIDGSVSADELAGATVVVGVTDPTRARMVTVPERVGGELPAALVDANAVNTLLTDSFIEPVPSPMELGALFLVSLLVALTSMWAPLAVSPAAPIAGAVGVWAGAVAAARAGWTIDVALLLGAVLAAYVAALAWRAAQEILRRRRLVGIFSQYVPAAVARQLIEPEQLRALTEGRRAEVTVLFCDLRGFTSMCARMEPIEVRVMLDRFYEAVSEVLLRHGGTIMHFNGDEVFGVFGAPLDQPDHAARALDAAAGLLALAQDPELALPPFGIGLNSGEVVAANVGSDLRRQYTVLGDAVNIGARLCSKAGRGEAVAATATVFMAGSIDLPLRPLAPMELKGVDGPVEAFVLRSSDLVAIERSSTDERSVLVASAPGKHHSGSP